MRDIAKLFDRSHSSIQRILTDNGGIRPRQRSRSSRALSLAEREVIQGPGCPVVDARNSVSAWSFSLNGKSRN